MRPIRATRSAPAPPRGFSAATMDELLRALRARALEHPESPGLVASWPGVIAERMPAACAELRRRGHPVREVALAPEGTDSRRRWTVDGAGEGTMVVRVIAEPSAVPLIRATVTGFAEAEGAPEQVRSSLALAVTEACSNVVMHAYLDADAPGWLEVRARRANAMLVVEVDDEGRGLLPRHDSPGLGLGLPLIAQVTDVLEIVSRLSRPGLLLRMQFKLAGAPENDRTGA
ncbi:ATP-binding protein [Solirubrobacter ginsenosidimutans]|uniref:ATP-binding protein n=1 Tax=Solirubrobacter ginsenosidimutans TaxID=490573 RepID=A0A9X3S4M5_9ACTN|nr:ATP-binding protein [Solirubrobacter ginsenosidimutans]MDA0163261.1 ATP-binding protein [Solirubrobacter ginsenosidimutans]